MIYLDHAATSCPKPPCVIRAVEEALVSCGNPGRSSHAASRSAGRMILSAREALCELFGTREPLNYCFTLNATDALNTVIHGMVRPDSRVLVSPMEHNSVLRPLYTLEKQGKVQVEILPADPLGRIDLSAFVQELGDDVSLVVLNHASNVTGIVQPVEEAVKLCREKNVPIAIDGSQAAGHLPVDLEQLDPDFYVCPGHKALLGPQGSGVLYLKGSYFPRPLRQGGTGSRSDERLQPEDLPDRYEAGTAATPAIAGLDAGIRFLVSHAREFFEYEQELYRELRDGILNLPSYTLYGLPDSSTLTSPVLSLNLKGNDTALLADRLEASGIACRAGLHCAPLAHRHLGSYPQGSVRLSLGALSRRRDVQRALLALKRIAEK